jgi:hypothetical protein
MAKVFERTENGTTTEVDVKAGWAEINHAMMAGKKDVRTMSSGGTQHSIEYKDGRKVRLVLSEVEDQAPAQSVNVVSVRGGKVHTKSAWDADGSVHALCRVSARTVYRETNAELTCDVCIENERRAFMVGRDTETCTYCRHGISKHETGGCVAPVGKYDCSCPYEGGRR